MKNPWAPHTMIGETIGTNATCLPKKVSSLKRVWTLVLISDQNWNSKQDQEPRGSMESEGKVELINLTERKTNKDASAQDDDQLLLSNLLSQESLGGDGVLKHPGGITGQEEATSSAVGEVDTESENASQAGGDGAEISREEIIRELRHVKKQNIITHCLLSVMIVVTFAWQLSEVQLILKVRDGVKHPFKAFGSMLTGMFKRPRTNGQDADERHQIEPCHLKMPELPRMEFPELGMNGERR